MATNPTPGTPAEENITVDPATAPAVGSIVAIDTWRPEGTPPAQLALVVGLDPLTISPLATPREWQLAVEVIS